MDFYIISPIRYEHRNRLVYNNALRVMWYKWGKGIFKIRAIVNKWSPIKSKVTCYSL